MIPALTFFIAVAVVFQIGILLLCWRHRKDPMFVLPSEQRSRLLIDILHIRNHVKMIRQFSALLLSGNYGRLNLSQQEFISQISEAGKKANSSVQNLIGKGKLLSLDAPYIPEAVEKNPELNTCIHFSPEPHSLLCHINEPPNMDESLEGVTQPEADELTENES